MKNQYMITKELAKKWAHESRFIGRNLAIFIIYMVIAAIFAAAFVMYAFFVESAWYNIYISILMCAISVFKAYPEHILNVSSNFKRFEKLNGATSWKVVFDFADSEINVTEGVTSFTYPYSGITKIVEKEDKYLVFFKNKAFMRLYKNAFVDCTEKECMDFIRSKIVK